MRYKKFFCDSVDTEIPKNYIEAEKTYKKTHKNSEF